MAGLNWLSINNNLNVSSIRPRLKGPILPEMVVVGLTVVMLSTSGSILRSQVACRHVCFIEMRKAESGADPAHIQSCTASALLLPADGAPASVNHDLDSREHQGRLADKVL